MESVKRSIRQEIAAQKENYLNRLIKTEDTKVFNENESEEEDPVRVKQLRPKKMTLSEKLNIIFIKHNVSKQLADEIFSAIEEETIEAKVDKISKQQEEIMLLFGEHNVLLTRNLGLHRNLICYFPLRTEDELQRMDEQLRGEKCLELTSIMKQTLCGNLNNLERIISRSIINDFNFDGTKEKKALKKYDGFLNALFESVERDEYKFKEFEFDLRATLRKIKNKYQKRKQRDNQQQMELDPLELLS